MKCIDRYNNYCKRKSKIKAIKIKFQCNWLSIILLTQNTHSSHIYFPLYLKVKGDSSNDKGPRKDTMPRIQWIIYFQSI